MPNETLRRQIVVEAARLVANRQDDDYFRVIRKAARRVCAGRVPRADLPSPRELHAELQRASVRLDEGLAPTPYLFDPLFVFDESDADDSFESAVDRFAVYRALLLPLSQVHLSRKSHPERDALYHSLQVYVLGRDELPYDEEFQTAALLHDVGKGIDPKDHVGAALDALDGFITDRTAWLIEHHDDAHRLRERTLGSRARRRLQATEDFETLELLADCDRRGRVVGMQVPDVEDALEQIRQLASSDE
ncbi:MAG: HD domain-containing protein [Planctomycetaceae bacterium]|nr:HD domain-containing protein [Planctomycetaceae bacterium]